MSFESFLRANLYCYPQNNTFRMIGFEPVCFLKIGRCFGLCSIFTGEIGLDPTSTSKDFYTQTISAILNKTSEQKGAFLLLAFLNHTFFTVLALTKKKGIG